MKGLARGIAASVLVSAGALACSEKSTGPANTACTEETLHVAATATLGADVTFDWSPKCGLSELTVVDASLGDEMWSIRTDQADWDTPALANRIDPVVTFGQAPPTVTDETGPVALVSGHSYQLSVWKVAPSASALVCIQKVGNNCMIGIAVFTR